MERDLRDRVRSAPCERYHRTRVALEGTNDL